MLIIPVVSSFPEISEDDMIDEFLITINEDLPFKMMEWLYFIENTFLCPKSE